MQYYWKLISTFHKKYPKKSTITLPVVDSVLPMARPINRSIKAPVTKQKCGWLAKANSINKYVKKSWAISTSFLTCLEHFQNFMITSTAFRKLFQVITLFGFFSLKYKSFFYQKLSVSLGTRSRYFIWFSLSLSLSWRFLINQII